MATAEKDPETIIREFLASWPERNVERFLPVLHRRRGLSQHAARAGEREERHPRGAEPLPTRRGDRGRDRPPRRARQPRLHRARRPLPLRREAGRAALRRRVRDPRRQDRRLARLLRPRHLAAADGVTSGERSSTTPVIAPRAVRRGRCEIGRRQVRAKVLFCLTRALSTPYARQQPVARGLTSGLGQTPILSGGGGPMRKLVSLATLS